MKAKVVLVLMTSMSLLALPACEKGSAEKAGEKIDRAADDVKDKAKEAADKISEKTKEAADKIEEKAKEAADNAKK